MLCNNKFNFCVYSKMPTGNTLFIIVFVCVCVCVCSSSRKYAINYCVKDSWFNLFSYKLLASQHISTRSCLRVTAAFKLVGFYTYTFSTISIAANTGTPGVRFSKIPRTFRARKASCQTAIRLF